MRWYNIMLASWLCDILLTCAYEAYVVLDLRQRGTVRSSTHIRTIAHYSIRCYITSIRHAYIWEMLCGGDTFTGSVLYVSNWFRRVCAPRQARVQSCVREFGVHYSCFLLESPHAWRLSKCVTHFLRYMLSTRTHAHTQCVHIACTHTCVCTHVYVSICSVCM